MDHRDESILDGIVRIVLLYWLLELIVGIIKLLARGVRLFFVNRDFRVATSVIIGLFVVSGLSLNVVQWLTTPGTILGPSPAEAQHQSAVPQNETLDTSFPNVSEWVGNGSGNIPNMEIRLTLRQEENRLVGSFDYSLGNGGFCSQSVEGLLDISLGEIRLRSTGMLINRPASGGSFCLIDDFVFKRSGESLSGEYWSEACGDRARLQLRRVTN